MQPLLRHLAKPSTPLTHDTVTAFNEVAHYKSVAYLRDLLMKYGVLPLADRHLMLFDRWLATKLDAIEPPALTR